MSVNHALIAWAANHKLTAYAISKRLQSHKNESEAYRKAAAVRWNGILKGNNVSVQKLESDLEALGLELRIVEKQPPKVS